MSASRIKIKHLECLHKRRVSVLFLRISSIILTTSKYFSKNLIKYQCPEIGQTECPEID